MFSLSNFPAACGHTHVVRQSRVEPFSLLFSVQGPPACPKWESSKFQEVEEIAPPVKVVRKSRLTTLGLSELFDPEKPPAASTLPDTKAVTIPDPFHTDDEDRLVLAGRSIADRLLVVVYVDRSDRIRIISARKVTRHERRNYEEGVPPDA